MRLTRFLLLLGVVGLSACKLDVAQPSDNPSDPTKETFASNLKVDIASMQKTSAGVYYKDILVGTGGEVTAPGPLDFTYAGFLKNGFLFDSGQLTGFNISGSVFGFQNGILGMKEGGERLIVIPSALGYGAVQVGSIPPNSTLVFDIKLEHID